MSEEAKHKLDEELEAFEAEREDETVPDELEVFEGDPDPDLEPQTWIRSQDSEDLT